MALEDQHRDIFLSRGCRLDYNHITGFIRPAFEGMFRCEMLQIGNNLLLVSRLSRDTGDTLEYLKNSVGIHISDILEVLWDCWLYRAEASIFSMSFTYCLKVLSVDIRSDTVVQA